MGNIPFTREIVTEHCLRLPFLDDALAGLNRGPPRSSTAPSLEEQIVRAW
jgi:hypothetical protein